MHWMYSRPSRNASTWCFRKAVSLQGDLQLDESRYPIIPDSTLRVSLSYNFFAVSILIARGFVTFDPAAFPRFIDSCLPTGSYASALLHVSGGMAFFRKQASTLPLSSTTWTLSRNSCEYSWKCVPLLARMSLSVIHFDATTVFICFRGILFDWDRRKRVKLQVTKEFLKTHIDLRTLCKKLIPLQRPPPCHLIFVHLAHPKIIFHVKVGTGLKPRIGHETLHETALVRDLYVGVDEGKPVGQQHVPGEALEVEGVFGDVRFADQRGQIGSRLDCLE